MHKSSVVVLVGVVLALLKGAVAQKLAVDNRAALSVEWGYRPTDGSRVVMNPPSLTWIHDKRAKSYDVEWSVSSNFTASVTITNHPWCVYTHNKVLEPGRYFWRYRFTTDKRQTSGWSVTRSFVVTPAAIHFPMIERAEQARRLPHGHPRLFMRPEDLPRLRGATTNGATAVRFANLRKEADALIKKGPTPEPTHRGSARNKSDVEAVKYWWPNRMAADRAGREAELLAFVWLMTREPKYGAAARHFINELVKWDPDGPSNFSLNCEVGKAMLYHPARAYDWAYDVLTPTERAAFRKVWLRRVQDAWKSGEIGYGNGHLTRPQNSHGNRIWHKVAEVAIALYGDEPLAATWLDYALNKFYAAYPVWSDDDGGWHEGAAYFSSYMFKVTDWMQVAHSALGINGLTKPFFAQVGNLPLYLLSPKTPNGGFGDLSSGRPSGVALHYFTRMKGADPAGREAAEHWAWWLKTTGTYVPGGWLGFLYEANLPPLPPAVPPSDTGQSKIFKGTGIASLHDTLLDSREDVHLLFKASPYGTISHGHNAQLGILLNAYGDCLLPSCNYRDLHGSEFHYKWVHATRSQNSVLVNGGGQVIHASRAQGGIVEALLDRGDTLKWDYVRGKAPAAYTGMVTRAERAILFVKPDLIVMYDDFATPQPATFQFMLHGLAPFTLDQTAQTLRLEQPNAILEGKYLAPQPLTFSQSDGYEPPPRYRNEQKPFPNQWHLEAGFVEPALSSDTLTVLVAKRKGATESWSAERLDSPSASGLLFKRGDRTIGIAFRKHGIKNAEWGGQPFQAAVMVR